jgi:hypothetical protein
MALTAEQIAARKGRMTASRIGVLMRGDRDGIMRLYREMIGDEAEEDLSGVWAVRLGEITEPLSLEWYERKNNPLTRKGEVAIHPKFDWAAATLDGFDETLQCCVEAKHCGGREPIDPVLMDRYAPQCHWQMFVTNTKLCALSIIMGANEPIVEYIDRDDAYIKEMVTRAESFMMCVGMRVPPFALEPAPPPQADPTKIVDMSSSNKWCDSAFEWLTTKDAAASNKDSEKILKAMVGSDVKKAFGAGCRITRDRAGRLSLREDK